MKLESRGKAKNDGNKGDVIRENYVMSDSYLSWLFAFTKEHERFNVPEIYSMSVDEVSTVNLPMIPAFAAEVRIKFISGFEEFMLEKFPPVFELSRHGQTIWLYIVDVSKDYNDVVRFLYMLSARLIEGTGNLESGMLNLD